jgi:hypothetical protein
MEKGWSANDVETIPAPSGQGISVRHRSHRFCHSYRRIRVDLDDEV